MRRTAGEGGVEHELYLSNASLHVQLLCRVTGRISNEELRSSIDHAVHGKLSDIIRLALRLREVIGENIISCDFIALLPSGDEIFNGQSMQEDGADPSEHQDNLGGSRVLCTTELGLLRAETVPREDGSQRIQDVILKPKVALTSLLLASTLQALPKERGRRHRAAADDKQAAFKGSAT
ncbi:hypothetical protein OE88DRAFT_1660027 [Heliocybe sulcata]|uniref:Uncharacterized protein n=1 Tax=Heliocybe sulcata TaxID=5364 RepID=A0A5C3N0A1_9AGAM|nr:hypothetical protein OE88DRAFT_1660027 [Heliocybe sulcata]